MSPAPQSIPKPLRFTSIARNKPCEFGHAEKSGQSGLSEFLDDLLGELTTCAAS